MPKKSSKESLPEAPNSGAEVVGDVAKVEAVEARAAARKCHVLERAALAHCRRAASGLDGNLTRGATQVEPADARDGSVRVERRTHVVDREPTEDRLLLAADDARVAIVDD